MDQQAWRPLLSCCREGEMDACSTSPRVAGVSFVERRYEVARMFACLAIAALCAATGCTWILGIEDLPALSDAGPPASGDAGQPPPGPIDAGMPSSDAALPGIDAALPACEPGPPGADAGVTSCAGTLIENIPLEHEEMLYGYLDVYYDDATGINCAMTRAVGDVYGNATWIDVQLRRCTQTSEGPVCNEDAVVRDCGSFLFFAGPVSLEAAGKCINARGALTYNGQTVSATTSPPATRCGL